MDAKDLRDVAIAMGKLGSSVTIECDIVADCAGKRVGLPIEEAISMTVEEVAEFLDESIKIFDQIKPETQRNN